MIERNISLLHERIRSLNNSFQATKKLFDINSRNLTRIQTLRNETTERVLRLKEVNKKLKTCAFYHSSFQAQAQNGMNISSLQNQTSQKRMSANEDYLRAQRLRERMMKLRTKAHDQLLESRSKSIIQYINQFIFVLFLCSSSNNPTHSKMIGYPFKILLSYES